MSILIVDDSESARRALQELVEGWGYRDVVTYPSGEEMLQDLLGPEDKARADAVEVVLLDIEMPGLDGIETCRRINAAPRLADLPVLIVTGAQEESTLEEAFSAGAWDFLTKPVQPVELRARLRSALTLHRELVRSRQRAAELLAATTQLQKLNEELQRLAILDELTGIANRRFFNMTLAQEWGRAAREGQPLALLLIDIDYFKGLNDHYGHPHGDACLKQVAAVLQHSVGRAGDLVARYGGEEFAVLMPHTGLRGAATVAERLRRNVERLGLTNAHSPIHGCVTVSVGVASVVPEGRSSPEQLLVWADQALYEAKRGGRNRIKLRDEHAEHSAEGYPAPCHTREESTRPAG